MRVELVAFTDAGLELACRLADALAQAGDRSQVSAPPTLAQRAGIQPYESLATWVEQAFAGADALVFVSACGIAVRAIAPCVCDKFHDPAVVCLDEGARHVIPLLSGHVGGANRLARRLAGICGAQPVITTATDVRGIFAVDEWAAMQGLVVLDREVAKEVSAELLAGGTVGLASDFPIAGAMPEGLQTDRQGETCALGICISFDELNRPFARTLRLVPRTVTVGIGCKRGTACEQIAAMVDRSLSEAHLPTEAVCGVASIDVKADEEGLQAFCKERDWKLRLHSATELSAVSGDFTSSAFVERTVGVGNVCERAACAAGGRLLLPRRSGQGVTVALGARVPRLAFPPSAEEGDCS